MTMKRIRKTEIRTHNLQPDHKCIRIGIKNLPRMSRKRDHIQGHVTINVVFFKCTHIHFVVGVSYSSSHCCSDPCSSLIGVVVVMVMAVIHP